MERAPLGGFTGFVDGVANASERFSEVDTSEVRLPSPLRFVLIPCPSRLDGDPVLTQPEENELSFRGGIDNHGAGGVWRHRWGVGGVRRGGRVGDEQCRGGVGFAARQNVALVRAKQQRFDLEFAE